MAAAAALFNQHMAAGQALTGKIATPMDSSTSGTSGSTGSGGDSSGDSATISANDFLTLLVTEMQNQDPTADTDPNEYINQLVQVNSLEQLIDINQNLSTALGDPTNSSSSSASSPANGKTAGLTGATASAATAQAHAAAHKAGASAAARSAATGTVASSTVAAASVRRAPGNLGVPEANPAAHRVAHALDGRSRMQPVRGGPSRSR